MLKIENNNPNKTPPNSKQQDMGMGQQTTGQGTRRTLQKAIREKGKKRHQQALLVYAFIITSLWKTTLRNQWEYMRNSFEQASVQNDRYFSIVFICRWSSSINKQQKAAYCCTHSFFQTTIAPPSTLCVCVEKGVCLAFGCCAKKISWREMTTLIIIIIIPNEDYTYIYQSENR